MYRIQHNNNLGFSLKPPDWLQKIVSGITGGTAKVVNPIQPNEPAPTPAFLNLGIGPDAMPAWVIPVGIAGLVFLMMKRKR